MAAVDLLALVAVEFDPPTKKARRRCFAHVADMANRLERMEGIARANVVRIRAAGGDAAIPNPERVSAAVEAQAALRAACRHCQACGARAPF